MKNSYEYFVVAVLLGFNTLICWTFTAVCCYVGAIVALAMLYFLKAEWKQ